MAPTVPPLPPGQRERWLSEQVDALKQEVDDLQAKLGDLHATDLMSLRRAYKSLAQHVQALEVESRHLPALLDRATEPGVTPDFVAQQTRLAAAVTAAVYTAGRLLQAARVREAGPISALLALLGAGYVGVRLLAATVRRLGAAAGRRRRAEAELRADLRAVLERVQIISDLAESGLRLHRLHASQHTSFQYPTPPAPQLRTSDDGRTVAQHARTAGAVAAEPAAPDGQGGRRAAAEVF